MIGDNIPAELDGAAAALACAAAIAALRAETECIEATYKPHLDALAEDAKAYRAERDGKTAPLVEREDKLRKVLAEYLAGDPDGNLREGARIVATLSRKAGKPQIHADQVPDAFKSMQPDIAKINLALAAGKTVPGVSIPITSTLRVS